MEGSIDEAIQEAISAKMDMDVFVKTKIAEGINVPGITP
jgi:hypothetical protein